MAYTPFALLASVIIISMAFTATNSVDSGTISQEYLHSVENSWSITQTEYAINAADILAEETIDGQKVENFETAARNLTMNGTYKGARRTSNSYLNWSNNVKPISSRIEDIELENLKVSAANVSLRTESIFKIELEDRNRTFRTVENRKVTNVTDPVLEGVESREINACSFDRLAEKQFLGSEYNGTARGLPVVEPADASSNTVDNRADKILFSSDVTNYSSSNVQEFAGYSSGNAPNNPGNYNEVFVVDSPYIPDFDSNQRAIIHEGLWKSNFARAQNNECYLPTSLEQTPSIPDRIENKTRGSTSQGIYTILSDLSSSESDIGYERKDATRLNDVSIEGVSTGQGGTWPDYSMSESLAESTGLRDLVS